MLDFYLEILSGGEGVSLILDVLGGHRNAKVNLYLMSDEGIDDASNLIIAQNSLLVLAVLDFGPQLGSIQQQHRAVGIGLVQKQDRDIGARIVKY